jgi:hypothetical protein
LILCNILCDFNSDTGVVGPDREARNLVIEGKRTPKKDSQNAQALSWRLAIEDEIFHCRRRSPVSDEGDSSIALCSLLGAYRSKTWLS